MVKTLTNLLIRIAINKNVTSNIIKINNFYSINRYYIININKNNDFYTLTKKFDSNTMNFDYNEAKTYKEFLDEKKLNSPKSIIPCLMQILDVTKDNAIKAVKNYPFNKTTRKILISNNHLLRDVGVNKSTLKDNMYALAETNDDLRIKIDYLRRLHLDMNHLIPLIQLPIFYYSQYFHEVYEEDKKILDFHRNRFEYFCRTLDMNLNDLCWAISKKPFLLTLNISKVIEITDFFLQSGVSTDDIKRDFVSYRYSLDKIRSRIKRAMKARISPLKLWVIRCPEEILAKAEEQENQRQMIFKSAKTKEEYLKNIFDCKINEAKALMIRNPHLKSTNLKKFADNVNLLKNYGYNIRDIYSGAIILNFSTKTIIQRYEEWMKHDIGKPFLSDISCNRDIFETRLKKAVDYKNSKL